MTIKFNNPIIQTLAEAVVEKHGGTVRLLNIPSAGIIMVGDMNPEYEAMLEQQICECKQKAAAIRDSLAVCRLARSLGAEVIEVDG